MQRRTLLFLGVGAVILGLFGVTRSPIHLVFELETLGVAAAWYAYRGD